MPDIKDFEEFLTKCWKEVKPDQRELEVWRYCKVHGSIKNFDRLCDDSECSNCMAIKEEFKKYKL